MGKPKDQSLAISYSIQRKPKKKMAKGGPVSAKTEKRPSPDERGEQTSRNSGDKPAHMDSVISRPDIAQSQRGPKTTKLKHPSMAQSPVFKVRMRDEEDHLESNDPPGPTTEQPPEHDNEDGPDRQGPDTDSLHMKKMAYGGKAEDDGAEHPAGLEEDDDMMGDPDAMNDHMTMLAEGGMTEMHEDHADSIAAAIMARRDRLHAEIDSGAHDLDEAVRMAEGGEVDLHSEHEEEPNNEDQMSFEALKKENYNSSDLDMDQPEDSNEHGHDLPDEDSHDMVESIRRKAAARRQFKAR